MKKLLFSLAAIFMVIASVVTLSSCSDDDKEDVKGPSIEGTWKGSICTGSITINGNTKYYYSEVTLNITKNQFDVTYEGKPYSFTFEYKYSSINDRPYIVVYKGSEDMGALYYEVNGNTLKFTGTNGSWGMGFLGEYTRQ